MRLQHALDARNYCALAIMCQSETSAELCFRQRSIIMSGVDLERLFDIVALRPQPRGRCLPCGLTRKQSFSMWFVVRRLQMTSHDCDSWTTLHSPVQTKMRQCRCGGCFESFCRGRKVRETNTNLRTKRHRSTLEGRPTWIPI